MTQKSILITGCSSGIGLYAAEYLQQKGYRVFATARKTEAVAMLNQKNLESLLLDVNDSASIQQAVTEILMRTGGTLDALFNNGGYVQAGAIEDLTRDMMRAQFETNVFGAMELTNLVLPIMRQQGHGRIIQNTSILGMVTMPFRGAYSASKFAFEGFSRALRQELRNTDIHVSMIVPGPIQSSLREKARTIYEETLKNKNTIHQKLYQAMEKNFFVEGEKKRSFTLGSEAVMPALMHALESRHPKAHYYIGFPARLFAFLQRILPDASMEWLMRQILRGEVRA